MLALFAMSAHLLCGLHQERCYDIGCMSCIGCTLFQRIHAGCSTCSGQHVTFQEKIMFPNPLHFATAMPHVMVQTAPNVVRRDRTRKNLLEGAQTSKLAYALLDLALSSSAKSALACLQSHHHGPKHLKFDSQRTSSNDHRRMCHWGSMTRLPPEAGSCSNPQILADQASCTCGISMLLLY